MATSASTLPSLVLEISCTGRANTMQEIPSREVTAAVIEFLDANGIAAHEGIQKGTGAIAGIPEVIKAASLAITIGKGIARFLANRARKQVRTQLPQVVLRLESSVELRRHNWNLLTAIPVSDILASLGELSVVLRRDYPLLNFEYFVSGAKGDDAWVNVTVPDELVSYTMLHRLRQKVASKRTNKWTKIWVQSPWWNPWGFVRSNRQEIDNSDWDCRDPRSARDV